MDIIVKKDIDKNVVKIVMEDYNIFIVNKSLTPAEAKRYIEEVNNGNTATRELEKEEVSSYI